MANKIDLAAEAKQNAANGTYMSDATQQAQNTLNSYGSNPYAEFKTSDATNNAYNYWQSVQANKPADYQSNWSGTINNLLDQIVNRKEFSYDFNSDPLYQQYKDQYTTQGKNAMKDTIAQTSALSGGYGNSYATTAGSQAYQSYLQKLNDVIPQLYDKAMQKYQMDTDTLMNKYNAVGSQEDREYGQWSTNYGLWQGDRDYSLNAYNTLWNQDFNVNQFNSNNWNADRSFALDKFNTYSGIDQNAYNNAFNSAQYGYDMDYKNSRDAVADDQWQQNFDRSNYEYDTNLAYQKERDAVADNQWAMEYALKKASAARSGTGSKSSSSENKTLTDTDKKTLNNNEVAMAINLINARNNYDGTRDSSINVRDSVYEFLASRDLTDNEIGYVIRQLENGKYLPKE